MSTKVPELPTLKEWVRLYSIRINKESFLKIISTECGISILKKSNYLGCIFAARVLMPLHLCDTSIPVPYSSVQLELLKQPFYDPMKGGNLPTSCSCHGSFFLLLRKTLTSPSKHRIKRKNAESFLFYAPTKVYRIVNNLSAFKESLSMQYSVCFIFLYLIDASSLLPTSLSLLGKAAKPTLTTHLHAFISILPFQLCFPRSLTHSPCTLSLDPISTFHISIRV